MTDTGGMVLSAPMAGWAMPLADVPDAVFAQGMMGSGVAIDPVDGVLHAPCDATVTSIHAARHAVALTTDDGAELLLHIGIDSVAMGGEGFEALVAPATRVAAGTPLIRFDLDLLARRASATATPVLVVGEGFVATPIATGRIVAIGEPLLSITRVADTAAPAPSANGNAGRWESLTVALPHGLHARPAARIAAAVRGRDAVVTLVCGDRRASALSMTGLLGIGAVHGAHVSIEAQGADADAVTAAIVDILTATSEPDSAPPPPPARPRIAVAELEPGVIAGVGAVPGVAIGTVRWLRAAEIVAPPGSGNSAAERDALARGLDRLRAELEGGHGVMAAHRAMLEDPDLLMAFDTAVADGRGAAEAALSVTRAQAAALAANSDPRLAERADDLRDIGQRLASAILGTTPEAFTVCGDEILLADDLLPSQLAALVGMPAGIAIVRGGPTSHVAIMAAARGIPMVVALGQAVADLTDGATLIVDGDAGTVHLAPDDAALTRARTRIATSAEAIRVAREGADGRPATTSDGHEIAVCVNLGDAIEAAAAIADGAEGCGLLRTELLFLDRPTPPTRDEQAATYRAIATAMAGRPLTIRLLDIGGDKPAPYLAIPAEENPALGLRGIRVALAHPDVLEAQVAAILDAADAGPVKIMVPMVASLAEVMAVRAVVDRLRGDRQVSIGAMVETPAAAIAADLIAQACDFLSIGTNDLTQYALAMDRGNAAVAGGIDGLHPAVLRLIAATCEGAARHKVPVGVCGGMAADPLAAPILIGLGVVSLSVPPARVVATRALVAGLSHAAARAHAATAQTLTSAAEVRALARAFAQGNAA
ncbi:phosphoenolpyruvate--protein phosphotransferase [Sphingomonas floccifaciens]|uniref:phosphoenolpyruvate--protein phosphotransferase n=1 Tax=Sphingomonas floccifaciens TaxID=1844115 RepID=A0ABW4NI38_9SPHN